MFETVARRLDGPRANPVLAMLREELRKDRETVTRQAVSRQPESRPYTK